MGPPGKSPGCDPSEPSSSLLRRRYYHREKSGPIREIENVKDESDLICESGSDNYSSIKVRVVDKVKGSFEGNNVTLQKRVALNHAKYTSSRTFKNKTIKYFFSLGNGLILILILLLVNWLGKWPEVNAGFPGRGPPGPHRGPPLFPHHPVGPNRPPSPFNRRRLGPPPPPHRRNAPIRRHNNKPSKNSGLPSDLAVAAQTLYDLRGYHHLSGPETPRFQRQNDPFTLPTPLSPNNRPSAGVPHLQQDTRTAPLVFPSFYQEQPTPTPTRATIFGHNQHLSQTRFEPPGSFHLGGNSASTKITLEQQSSSSRDQFRPSQIDISLHNNGVSTPLPPAFPSFVQVQTQAPSSPAPEKKLTQTTSRTRAPVKLSKNQQQDPFVYVYDEVDYDEGDEDVPGSGSGRLRAPQSQINTNRITSSTSTTTPPTPVIPLRTHEPQILTSPNPNPFGGFQFPQAQYHHHQLPNSQLLYNPSTTTTQPPTTTANSLFFDPHPQKDDLVSPYRNPAGIIRPPVTARPNVEIVPSSERRPPPDQSNAITPVLTRNHGSARLPTAPQTPLNNPLISDNYDIRTRRPQTTTSTLAPPTPTALIPHYQRENVYPLDQSQLLPQGRQVSPSPTPTPIPYFPAGLDRRPFEKNNEIPLDQTRNNPFSQVVNILQDEEDDYQQKNTVHGEPVDPHQGNYDNPSKLRPVNTIIPKNRIPKEDILLPPNFPYTHVQNELTSTLSPVVPQEHLTRIRSDPTQQRVRDKSRNREELPPRIREEPKVPYRNLLPINPSTPIRSRPSSPVYFPEEEEEVDDNFNLVNDPGLKSQQTPQRIRGRPLQQQRTTTTTTTTPAPQKEAPQRGRTVSPRQRLRPNYNRQPSTTTTFPTTSRTTTTTTPVPSFVEYPSQEYLDDYEQPIQNNQSPRPSQLGNPNFSQQQKPLSRFPPFPNKKDVSQDLGSPNTPPSPSSFQRPQQTTERIQPQRLNNNNRGRFNNNVPGRESTTSPRTTGKPLYTTGKMLAKEGGVYAGHRITSGHIYGQPIPSAPINNFDKRPSIITTTKPSFGSPQKHLRSKQRQPEHGPPSRINASGGPRIRPTVRTVQENTLDIVETVTLRPYQDDKVKSPEEPKRLRAGSQFIRGQQNPQESVEKVTEGGQQVLPRRRKVRPGRKQPFNQQQQLQSSSVAPDAFSETVSIHPQRNEEDVEENVSVHPFNNNRGQVIRDGQNGQNRQAAREEAGNQNQPQRPRRPRPRPGKLNQSTESSSSTTVSERSREREDVTNNDEQQIAKPIKPIKKLRPRLRPVPVGQLNQQQQQPRGQPSETVVQQAHSAQVDRKPTDAPGRFSSRFREDNYEQTTVSTTPRGDEDERESSSSGPNRFSPSNVRPTFRPPLKKNPQGRKQRPQQQQNSGESNDSDAIPESIKLSPKDVIANRKPARRIPPGSASDRLKALQQRRKKIFSPQSDGEPAEGRQVPVTKRPGFRPFAQNQNDDDRPFPSERPQQQQRQSPHRQSAETVGPKREVLQRAPQQKLVQQQQDDEYYNNEDNRDEAENEEKDEDNSEYDEVSPPPRPSPRPKQFQQQQQQQYNQQQSVVSIERPPKSHGFHRNRSIEVTSDEARSVLGIPRPAAPNRTPGGKRIRPLPLVEDELDDGPQFQQQNRPRPRPRLRQRTEQVEQEQQEREAPVEVESRPPQQLQQRPKSATLRPKTQFHIPQEEDEDDSEYQDDDKDELPVPPPRKIIKQQHSREFSTSTSSVSPVSDRPLDNEEDPSEEEEEDIPQRSTLVTTTTRTSSSSTSSQPLPVALPMRAGPPPIKQGALKPRLRPNLKARFNDGNQPRVSISASTTEATITTISSSSESVKRRPGGRLKQGKASSEQQFTQQQRPFRGGGGGGGGHIRNKKFIAMATENPSLPLESIFPEMS